MLTTPVVPLCPHTETAQGVMKLAHPVIAALAGAVHDDLEWLALLIGTRSEDGLTVTVKSLRVPLQERSTGNCSLVRQEPLSSEVVGVVHSHHRMRAFFSTIDDTTLNTRFPTSIVIAQLENNPSPDEALLGFSYQVEGRVALPCGSIGVIGFTVLPMPAMEMWPETPQVGFHEPSLTTTLNHCPHANKDLQGLQYRCNTKCGIMAVEPATAIFGTDSKSFMTEVREKTQKGRYTYQNPLLLDNRSLFEKHKPRSGDHWRDNEYWEHWGAGY